MTDAPLELVYKGSCPYCRMAAKFVRVADRLDKVATTEIESPRGYNLVYDHHDEFVESPHLFTPDRVYYGVGPCIRGLVANYPRRFR